MGCEYFELPNGATAIVCGRRRAKGKPCVGCGRVAVRLCDAPVNVGGKTCDAAICASCAVHDGPDLDFCPSHVAPRDFIAKDVREWAEFLTERAAIAQFIGGLAPMAAEALARRLAGPRPSSTPATPVAPPALVARDQLELSGFTAARSL